MTEEQALNAANDRAKELLDALEQLWGVVEANNGQCVWQGKLSLLIRRIENCATHPALAS